MDANVAHIVSRVKSSLNQIYGERLSKVILFGSYARGTEHDESDIDLLVVLKDKQISAFREIENINAEIYEIILDTGKMISFVPTTEDIYASLPNFFYSRVRAEGKVI